MMAFEIGRDDGRSNAQVILDLVETKGAGDLIDYAEFKEALDEGTPHVYDNSEISSIIGQANKRLLPEQQRRLHNVRGRGYRIAKAHEHVKLFESDHRKELKLRKRGQATLVHLRENELTRDQRDLVVAIRTWVENTNQTIASHEARLNRHEELIQQLHEDKAG